MSERASKAHEERKRGLPRWLIIGLLLLPVIYVLGIGPAERLRRAGVLPTGLYVPLYRPLIELGVHWPGFNRFLGWYVEDVWKCEMF